MRKKVWTKTWGSICKRGGAACLCLSLLLTGGIGMGGTKVQAETGSEPEMKTGEIVINGNHIRTDNVNGLTFKGFGILSGNSTSDLLMDYKAQNPEAYAELMQYLFGGKYPIMNHVKLEMGNDSNTSTGAETSTMRTKGEPTNVIRSAGWQLAADAKKINPNIKVSILCWCTPYWVKTDEDKYIWYKKTILAAYEKYGFMVDYINPNTNESWNLEDDVAYTKLFAKWIAAESEKTIADKEALVLFKKIKLVVSDEAATVSDSVAESLKSDQEFNQAVSVVGYHYSPFDDENGGMKWFAEEQDKEVWNSEAQAVFSNSAFRPANNVKDPTVAGTGIGGTGSPLEMGNTFIKGFVESRRSHVIYQPAIGSFYEGGQYSFKELVSARDPWSGWMHYDAGLLVLAHLSKFAVTGWENEDNTAGIWRVIPEASKSTAEGQNPVNGRNGGENYITLASPAKDNFSTMIVNDSEYPMTYTLKTQNMNLPEDAALELWETRAADEGAFNENYLKCLGDLTKNAQGEYTINVKPYSTVTVTSLDMSDDAEHTEPLPVEGERTVLDTDAGGDKQDTESGYLYADDFEYEGKTVPVLDGQGGFTGETEDYITARGGEKGAMARYTHTVNGAFEVYKSGTGNHVLRQQIDQKYTGVGSAWNSGDPATFIGDFRWMNYTASVDALFERTAEKQYAALAIRQIGGQHRLERSSGYTLKVEENGNWTLYRKKEAVLTGTAAANEKYTGTAGNWFQLKLRGEGATIYAYINGVQVAKYVDENPITSGRVGLGSGRTYTRFDNLAVTKIKGYAPYYTELLDNMEMYDLSPEKNTKLVYAGNWTHTNGQGMFVYQRSMSYSAGTGASLTYDFTGTGMEILGSNKAVSNAGKANEQANKVNVTVDGTLIRTADPIRDAEDMNTTYTIEGLEYGNHTVTIEVAEGALAVDSIGIIGDLYQGEEIETQPKEGSEANLPEEELPKDLNENIVPDLGTPGQQPGQPSAQPSPQPTQSSEPALEKGTVLTVKGSKYQLTDVNKHTATYQAPVSTKVSTVTIPATIKVQSGGKTVSYKVTAISAKAFTKCNKLKKVTIGKNVKSIGKNAFKNCKSLKTIAIKSDVLKSVGNNAIKGIYKKAVITCGKKKLKAYKKLFAKKTGYKKSMKIKKG